jgi:cyclic beta-1,2-glucan synthetase
LAFVIALFWIILSRSQKRRIINVRDIPLTVEELEGHARDIAVTHALYNRKNCVNWPIPRMNDNYAKILSTYQNLNEDLQKQLIVPDAAEWLLDNFYIIEERVKVLKRDTSKKTVCGSLSCGQAP